MNPVSIPPLKDYIIEVLRGEIFAGRLQDGEELSQEEIASQLNVSRIPVREAFLQLVTEGLLVRLPNRHVQVVGMTASRLWQNFHVLASIESEIALQLLSNGNTSSLGDAFALCQKYYGLQEWSLLRRSDREFHLSISIALGNHTLRQLHEVQHRVLFSGSLDQVVPDWEKVIRLDEEIWRAVRTKNESSLRRCIYEYYTVLAQDTVKELKL